MERTALHGAAGAAFAVTSPCGSQLRLDTAWLGVNVPNITPSGGLKDGRTRVLCFHKNVPGVLRDINAVISNGNISYQALSTDEDNGYLMVDIDSEVGKDVKEKLEAVENTTRNYVLFQGAGYCGEHGI